MKLISKSYLRNITFLNSKVSNDWIIHLIEDVNIFLSNI